MSFKNYPQYHYDDIEIIQHKTVYDGYFSIEQYQLQFRLFAGGWSQTINREIFERGSAAALLPYDPQQDKVVLIEQFRPGLLHSQQSPWLLECVAGIIDNEEHPTACVEREAMEEAGLTIRAMKPIANYWVSPGGTSKHVSLFCGCVTAQATEQLFGLTEEAEDIKVHVASRQEAFDAVKDGTINNGATIIALQWLQLNFQSVREEWR